MEISHILTKQIKLLHSRKLPEDVAERIIKLGKPAYDRLFIIVDEPSLSSYQVSNILRVLYMMRYHGDIEVFVNKFLSFTQNERIEVRSTASYLLICLLRLKEEFSELNIPLQQSTLVQFLQNALAMKLDPVTTKIIEEFLVAKNDCTLTSK